MEGRGFLTVTGPSYYALRLEERIYLVHVPWWAQVGEGTFHRAALRGEVTWCVGLGEGVEPFHRVARLLEVDLRRGGDTWTGMIFWFTRRGRCVLPLMLLLSPSSHRTMAM